MAFPNQGPFPPALLPEALYRPALTHPEPRAAALVTQAPEY